MRCTIKLTDSWLQQVRFWNYEYKTSKYTNTNIIEKLRWPEMKMGRNARSDERVDEKKLIRDKCSIFSHLPFYV